MSQQVCSGWTFTLPLLVKPGQLVILGTLAHYGSMERSEVVALMGRLPASRAIASLVGAGWVRADSSLLTFAGTASQLDAVTALTRYGYTPLLQARDRVRVSGVQVPFGVRVCGSFAARLTGVRGRFPADIDLLPLYLEGSPQPHDLVRVLEDYSPSGQLEFHTVPRTVESLNDPDTFWGLQMLSRPWLDLDSLPEGKFADVDLVGNTAADSSVLFASPAQEKVLRVLLSSDGLSISELSRSSGVTRSRLREVLADLSTWVVFTQEYSARVVRFRGPQVVRDALNILLPRVEPRAQALMSAGALSVYAFGAFAQWLSTGEGLAPAAQLVAVNSVNWSALDVARVMYALDPDAEVVACSPEQWLTSGDRHLLAIRRGAVLQLG